MKDQVVELLHLMLRRGLIERAERFYSKPKPGRKRLSRWPNKLKQAAKSEQVQRCFNRVPVGHSLCGWLLRIHHAAVISNRGAP